MLLDDVRIEAAIYIICVDLAGGETARCFSMAAMATRESMVFKDVKSKIPSDN